MLAWPSQLGHHLGVDARPEHQRRVGVAEVVDAETGHLRGCGDLRPRSQEVSRLDRRADPGRRLAGSTRRARPPPAWAKAHPTGVQQPGRRGRDRAAGRRRRPPWYRHSTWPDWYLEGASKSIAVDSPSLPGSGIGIREPEDRVRMVTFRTPAEYEQLRDASAGPAPKPSSRPGSRRWRLAPGCGRGQHGGSGTQAVVRRPMTAR